jgi:hypothetical protein
MGGFDAYAFQIRMRFGFVPFDQAWADALQHALAAAVPTWAVQARVSKVGRWTVSERYDISAPGSLFESIDANRPGGARARSIVGPHTGDFASDVVLTGADRAASIRLTFLGLTSVEALVVETTQPDIDGEPAGEWVERLLRSLVAELRPRSAVASSLGERGAARRYGASGDVEWLTYLDPATVAATDVLRLRNTDGIDLDEVGDGLLIRIDPTPGPRRLKPYWTKVKAVEALIGQPVRRPPGKGARPSASSRRPQAAPTQLVPRPNVWRDDHGRTHVDGARFERMRFIGVGLDTPGAIADGFDLSRCEFDNVSVGSRHEGEEPVSVRNSTLHRSKGTVVTFGLVAFEDCTVDGYSGGFWGTSTVLLRHVVLRGNIDALFLQWPTFDRLRDRPSLARRHREYYETIDWALDISKARFIRCEIPGVPAHLVRRDPATQAVVTADAARRQAWNHAVEDHFWSLTLKKLAESERKAQVIVACPRGKKFEQELRIIARLRQLGVAEPD